MEYQSIETDFITRTVEILKEYNGKYEATLLVNLCIGLIVVPKEHHLNKLGDMVLLENDSSWGLIREDIEFSDSTKSNYTLKYLVRRLRNGITHFSIKAESENKEISKFNIKDTNPRNKNDYIVFSLTPESLKKLALTLANHVQKL